MVGIVNPGSGTAKKWRLIIRCEMRRVLPNAGLCVLPASHPLLHLVLITTFDM